MATRHSTQAVQPQTRYSTGDFVLYRDPEKFWTNQPGHTSICRVSGRWSSDVYELVELSTQHAINRVESAYIRLLPADEVMRDIDNAPLSEPDPAALTPAAVAWLRQHLRAEGGGNLPAQP